MAFTWKCKKDLWKGEGIYFLTFAVNNRVNLLGSLRRLEHPDADGHIAYVDASELGNRVYRECNALQARYEGLQVLAKQIMPDHFHVVVWCKEGFEGSVKMVARGFSQACSKVARAMWQEGRIVRLNRTCRDGMPAGNTHSMPAGGASAMPAGNTHSMPAGGASAMPVRNTHSMPAGGASAMPAEGASAMPTEGVSAMPAEGASAMPAVGALPSFLAQSYCAYDCGNGAGTLFAKPFIRTLAHAGQLRHMIDYTHANPDNAMMRVLNPQYYVIRRNIEISGLHFDAMGKHRLLDYPDRQVIALPRSLSAEAIASEVSEALRMAESGTVTYTAAMNAGEKAVSRAVREAGWPLVVMMPDGFPEEGTEAARYFHPSGVYHTACGNGSLLLLAPRMENYDNKELIRLTELELARKASEKRQHYYGIPHESTRWRMIAGNVMLRMIADGC